MLPKLSSAWVVSLLTLGLIRGSLTADAPIGVITLECEAATAEDAAGALFHEVELGAYRIEALARRCSAILADHAEDTREHLTAWLEILEETNFINDTLQRLAAGWQVLSVPQRRAWVELDGDARRIYLQAGETVRKFEESTFSVRSEQHVQALIEARDSSLRMTRIIVALDHCGEIRITPDAPLPFKGPEWNDRVQFSIWE